MKIIKKPLMTIIFLVLSCGTLLTGQQLAAKNDTENNTRTARSTTGIQVLKPVCPTEKKQITRKFLYRRKITEKAVDKRERPVDQEEQRNKELLLTKELIKMTPSELAQAKKYALYNGDKVLAIKYLERLITLSNNELEVQNGLFELGRLYFDTGDMKKAKQQFKKYKAQYPGSKDLREVEEFEILSRFYTCLKPANDQRRTIKVLNLANTYLAKYNAEALEKIKDIKNKCQENIFSYEYDIAEQYLIRKQYIAAKSRLNYIRSEMLPLLPDKEPFILQLEIALAQHEITQPTTEEIKDKIAQLQQKWPNFKPTLIAYDTPAKKPVSYIKRF